MSPSWPPIPNVVLVGGDPSRRFLVSRYWLQKVAKDLCASIERYSDVSFQPCIMLTEHSSAAIEIFSEWLQCQEDDTTPAARVYDISDLIKCHRFGDLWSIKDFRTWCTEMLESQSGEVKPEHIKLLWSENPFFEAESRLRYHVTKKTAAQLRSREEYPNIIAATLTSFMTVVLEGDVDWEHVLIFNLSCCLLGLIEPCEVPEPVDDSRDFRPEAEHALRADSDWW